MATSTPRGYLDPAWLPLSMAAATHTLCASSHQDEFDGITTALVYPGSPLATDLDNNLWLPDIVTYDAHRTTCTHAVYT